VFTTICGDKLAYCIDAFKSLCDNATNIITEIMAPDINAVVYIWTLQDRKMLIP